MKVSEEFRSSVEREMAFLQMPNVRLRIDREEIPMNSRGIDRLEFLISTNPGEEPQPVSKIALSRADFVETLIFDEIDTGISGSAADRVGKKLSQLSADAQILCVTHQAQIAAFADNHLFISKSVHDDRTFTSVTSLDDEGRIRELSRLVGGATDSESSLSHAGHMLDDADLRKREL